MLEHHVSDLQAEKSSLYKNYNFFGGLSRSHSYSVHVSVQVYGVCTDTVCASAVRVYLACKEFLQTKKLTPIVRQCREWSNCPFLLTHIHVRITQYMKLN
jgi:hypothetical protein